MSRSTLLVAVGAVLGGIAVLMTALAAAFEPLLLLVAAPFAVAGYLIWYQGTGRLAARARRQARTSVAGPGMGPDRGGETDADPRSDGGPRWADPERQARRERARRRAAAARAAGGSGSADGARGTRGGRNTGRTDRSPGPFDEGMTEREARDVLGVDPDSDAETVRRAYRRQVKETHPDTEAGDEEAFKRVTEAYERLGER